VIQEVDGLTSNAIHLTQMWYLNRHKNTLTNRDCFRMPAINDKPCKSICTKGRLVSTTFKDVPACWWVNSEGGSREVHPAGTSKFKYRRNWIFCIAHSHGGGIILKSLISPHSAPGKFLLLQLSICRRRRTPTYYKSRNLQFIPLPRWWH